ncbi:MAG TPA: LacI family DNA-binding transcriptional regulator [Chloroflexia bacterium]|nr:LacI family DNA-binding transcriptional regulator [Chloroflexia bacterium]
MTVTKKVTIRDVARHAGVSVATVSHVVNDTHYVTPELHSRVYTAISTLNYQPNRLARALSQKAIPLLALVVPDIGNPYWSAVARAVQDITDPHNYSVIVCSSDGQPEREARFLRSISGWVSGLILHPYHLTSEHVNRLSSQGVPVVVLGDFAATEMQPPHWDQVTSNNLGGARMAVEHLIGLGHRRIAFIEGQADTPSSLKRLAGYRASMEEASLPVDERWIVPGDYTQAGGRRAMAALLELPERPTAVFCANDLSALGALNVAQMRGMHVPADLSIVGFDDIDEAALASPPLTTISQRPQLVGTVIAETLIERLHGRTEPARRAVHGTLVVRESAAAPR